MSAPGSAIPRSAIIVGGGVAGAAAACLLAERGRDVLLVEREAGPHDKICGEFVSGEAAGYLARLGLDLAELGAEPIGAVRLVHRGQVARAALPFPAWGLSRRVLDAALLARAEAGGAEVLHGRSVRGLAAVGAGVAAEVDGVGRVEAPAVLLATGKHDLRGMRRAPRRAPEDLIGLKMHLSLAPAERDAVRGHVEVLLLDGGYAGLQLVEGGRANLCLLIGRVRFEAAGRCWEGLMQALCRESPHLAHRLAGAAPLMDRPLSIFRVPYGYVHRGRGEDLAGVFRLGDQMGVIPSFCGDGVSIALHTSFAAVTADASAAIGAGSAPAFHRRMRRDLGRQIGLASLLYRAGRAAPGLAVRGAGLWPGAVGWLARMTRVPEGALLRQGSIVPGGSTWNEDLPAQQASRVRPALLSAPVAP